MNDIVMYKEKKVSHSLACWSAYIWITTFYEKHWRAKVNPKQSNQDLDGREGQGSANCEFLINQEEKKTLKERCDRQLQLIQRTVI